MHQQQMVLGALLLELEISQASFARSVGLSPTALNKIICHGEWPKKQNRQELEQAIKSALAKAGATVAQAEVALLSADIVTEDNNFNLEPEMLSQVAKNHWKVSRDPFQGELLSPDDVYFNKQNRYLLAEMTTATLAGSMSAFVGECGSGKTTLKLWFKHEMSNKHGDVVLIEPCRIDKTLVTADGISHALCLALQLKIGGMSGEERDAAIGQALIESYNSGKRHVLLIDEAHDLPVKTLKIIKRFWELTSGFNRILGVVLIGQPELLHKLEGNYVREFSIRCAIYKFPPLEHDTPSYIRFKLGRVNLDADAIFTEEALKHIHSKCVSLQKMAVSNTASVIENKSFPQIINLLVTNALNVAAEIGESTIDEQFVIKHVSLIRKG